MTHGKTGQRGFEPLCPEGKTITSEYKARSFQVMVPIDLEVRNEQGAKLQFQHSTVSQCFSARRLREFARLLWLRFTGHRDKGVDLDSQKRRTTTKSLTDSDAGTTACIFPRSNSCLLGNTVNACSSRVNRAAPTVSRHLTCIGLPVFWLLRVPVYRALRILIDFPKIPEVPHVVVPADSDRLGHLFRYMAYRFLMVAFALIPQAQSYVSLILRVQMSAVYLAELCQVVFIYFVVEIIEDATRGSLRPPYLIQGSLDFLVSSSFGLNQGIIKIIMTLSKK
ncbi:hypothetical protein EV421DRAFT_1740490 [Armillaria borealis]|uniref:Uncharacterized protein n=1 Tax=Armillaria borealis TaxID=47425 RepID=A0AA39J3Q9_9AGAR|nr:hypothetical protein EV421DRAFT_1740490 [Armillaria borealis]